MERGAYKERSVLEIKRGTKIISDQKSVSQKKIDMGLCRGRQNMAFCGGSVTQWLEHWTSNPEGVD